MNEADKERLNKRLGWILCELGKEDYEIGRFKESLKMHIGRRNTMQAEGDRICKKLGMDVPEKKEIGEFENRRDELTTQRKRALTSLTNFYKRLPNISDVKLVLTEFKSHNDELIDYIIALESLWNKIDEARENFPQFKDFTHEPPDNLTAEDFLNSTILEFADFYGYITAIKEWFKKYLKKKVM